MTSDVFLTGGSGLVGGHLLSSLVADGARVTAMVRSAAAAAAVEDRGADPFLGDLLDTSSLASAMLGSDVVFHVAGVNEMCSVDPQAMDRTNIDGTRSVVEAAGSAGVGRVVYTSSVSVIGEQRGAIGTEATEHDGSFLSRYARSKFLGERAAFTMGEEFGVDVVAVNPASVQGPGRSGGSARILLHALRSRWPALVDVVFSVVDIDDCTRGHLLAATKGKPGNRYILSGGSISARAAVAAAESIAGRSIRPLWIPQGLMATVGVPVASIAARLRPNAGICAEFIRTLDHGHRFDGSKATRDLGLVYTPLDETFSRTIGWFTSEGLIRDA
ncbi:MAG: NAD-dependent epimerase/dehydratase family protein [Acidimicrobiia bacterium]